MNMTLIDPRKKTISPEPPLGLAYIAGYLRESICDINIHILDRTIYGYDNKKVIEYLVENKTDVVGVSIYTHTYPVAKELIVHILQNTNIEYVVLGGPHITICADEVCQEFHSKRLILMRGEGEEEWKELIECIKEGKDYTNNKGLVYYDGSKVIHNSEHTLIDNIDSIPFPARDLLDMNAYSKTGYTHVIASRGCPYACTFCSAATLWQSKFRTRSARNIVDEVKCIVGKYLIRRIAFYDDVFTVDHKRLEEICELLIKENLKIEWWCNGRVDTVDKKMLNLMYQAGCKQIFYGVESANQSTLDIIQKKTSPIMIENAIKLTKEAGIAVTCSFIIGLPFETYEMVLNTIKFIKKLSPEVIDFNFYKPYPGTFLTNKMEEYEMKMVDGNVWEKLSEGESIMGRPIVYSKYLSIEEQYKLYLIAARELGLLKQHAKENVR